MLILSFLISAILCKARVLDDHQNFGSGSLKQLLDHTELAGSNTFAITRSPDHNSDTTDIGLAKRAVPRAECGVPINPKLIPSCREAFDHLPDTGPVVISFGQRALKGQVDHVIPFLIISCELPRFALVPGWPTTIFPL